MDISSQLAVALSALMLAAVGAVAVLLQRCIANSDKAILAAVAAEPPVALQGVSFGLQPLEDVVDPQRLVDRLARMSPQVTEAAEVGPPQQGPPEILPPSDAAPSQVVEPADLPPWEPMFRRMLSAWRRQAAGSRVVPQPSSAA